MSLWAQYREAVADDPLLALALSAALLALALTPPAFAVLGRLDWFKARRGRVLQRPAFSSVVVGMVLVMGIPAVFAALVLKSRSFDRNRYEFDPNRTWSVLEQGRGFENLKEADAAVKREMERLALERKNLVDNLKKLDEGMLALRAVAGSSPLVAQRFPTVLQSLAALRRCVGLDGPQQLLDATAPPVDLKAANTGLASSSQVATPTVAAPPPAVAPSPAPAVAAPAGNGLSSTEVGTELASVPAPQRAIAAMLPLSDLPPTWTVGKSGDRHLETFNADNLYEKIDGRAESFLQYGVKGMAYAFYHPAGDSSNDVQLYIFEMADSLKALGKFGSEKPEDAKPVAIGDEGYTSAGSTLFYAGRFYTQVVSSQDDGLFAAFALELARRVAAHQKRGGAPAGAAPPEASGSSQATSAIAEAANAGSAPGHRPAAATGPAESTAPATTQSAKPEASPAMYFALLPARSRQGEAKYVAQDVFGYSFLSDVFMADYKDGEVTWQGFLRPYRDAQEANAVFEKYVAGVKKDGAVVKAMTSDGADQMVVTSNIGLVDVVFRKGNTLAGANGGTSAAPAEAFARDLARSLPPTLPPIESGK
jgi:hypothetical protein